MRNLKVLFLAAGLSLTLFSCGKDDDAGPNYATTVAIESLTPDGCLNVPAYFAGIQALDPNLPVLELTTDFSYRSKKFVRDKFGELMAYTTFRAGTRPVHEFGEFTSMSQNGCSELVVHSADGTTETFPVSVATRESLRAETQDGRIFQYTWLSPSRMIIDQTYTAFDLPCGNADPVLIRQRRVLDWSQAPLESFDLSKEPFNVNESYLAKVASAVGMSAGSLYTDGQINPAKLQEMAGRNPVPELLTCPGGDIPPPPPPPDDSGDPERPTEP